jgi:hypothetical protein
MDVAFIRLLFRNVWSQIPPRWIRLVDQFYFPRPVPFLDAFFPLDRRFHRRMHFVPYQPRYVVAMAESFNSMRLVLPDTANKVAGDTHIQGAIPVTCQEVNTGLLVHLGFVIPTKFPLSRE